MPNPLFQPLIVSLQKNNPNIVLKTDQSIAKNPAMLSKKLYVLCVGINEYKAGKVSNLDGCVNDANSILKYFTDTSENTDFEIDSKILVNEEATKANIVHHFKTHLGQAKKGDVAVFYFSGHGAEESADEVFEEYSHTDTFTTLVCHDSRVDTSDLADKELRYLIHQISGMENPPHFVLITDSCHSGGATRSDMKQRLTEKVDTRKWSDFIFSDKISRAEVESAVSLRDILPEGEHVHLSSCEDGELAYEVNGSGVFTSSLLNILRRSSGKVTYQDINSRTRLILSSRYPQKPTLYATDNEGYNQLFLGGSIENQGLIGNVTYDSKDNKWRLNLGTVHGISAERTNPTEIDLLDIKGDLIGTAVVDSANAAYSHVLIAPETLNKNVLNKNEIYNGLAKNIFRPIINFHITGDEEGVKILEDFYVHDQDKQAELKRKNFVFVEDELEAQYVIRAQNKAFSVTYPFDKRPLIRQLSYFGKKTFDTLDKIYLPQIARWEYLANLYNEQSQLSPKPPVEIKLYEVIDEFNPRKDKLLQPVNDEVSIKEGISIRIQIVNNYRRKKLYYTLFYMDRIFEIFTLSDQGDYLNPNADKWIYDKEAIPAELEPQRNNLKKVFNYVRKFNLESTFFVLKLVCCTEDISLHELKQPPLPTPIYPIFDTDLQDRPLKKREKPNVPDWATHSVTVRILNKDFDESKKSGEV